MGTGHIDPEPIWLNKRILKYWKHTSSEQRHPETRPHCIVVPLLAPESWGCPCQFLWTAPWRPTFRTAPRPHTWPTNPSASGSTWQNSAMKQTSNRKHPATACHMSLPRIFVNCQHISSIWFSWCGTFVVRSQGMTAVGSHASQRQDMARPSAGSRPWDDLGQKLMMFGCLGTKQLGAVYHSNRIHGAAIYGNIYHQYTPNVSIYTVHGSYGIAYPGSVA